MNRRRIQKINFTDLLDLIPGFLGLGIELTGDKVHLIPAFLTWWLENWTPDPMRSPHLSRQYRLCRVDFITSPLRCLISEMLTGSSIFLRLLSMHFDSCMANHIKMILDQILPGRRLDKHLIEFLDKTLSIVRLLSASKFLFVGFQFD